MAIKLGALYYEIEARTQNLTSGVQAAERRLEKFAGVIRAHPVAALGALAASAALVGLEAARMAAAFDTAMRKVTVLLPEATGKIEGLKTAVLGLSTRLPFTAEALAAALRVVVQVGGREMREPTEAMTRLELAARGALATGEDLATVTKTLDDVMDAFGLSGQRAAAETLDLVTRAGQAGVAFEDMTAVLLRAGPAAAAHGVSLERLVAMVVALGNMGVATRDQIALLRGAFGGAAEAGETLKGKAAELGITVEQLNGQWVLARRGAAQFATALGEISTSAGAVQRGVQTALGGAGAQMQLYKNTVNSVMTSVGNSLITGLGQWIQFHRAMNGLDPLTGEPIRGRTVGGFRESPWDPFGPGAQAGPPAALAGRAGRPSPTPLTAEQISGRAALESELAGRLASLTTSTIDNARVAVEKLAAEFERTYGHRIPEAAAAGLAQLRANLATSAKFQNYADSIAGVEKQVDGLIAKQEVSGEEWQRQMEWIAGLEHSLRAWVEQVGRGTEQGKQGLALLQRIEGIQERITAAKKDQNVGEGKTLVQQKNQIEVLEAQARNIEAAARGALQLASAFGIVDEKTASALQNIAQIAANLPAALKGKPTSILSVLGGLAGLISSIGGGGESPEERAASQRREEHTRELTEAIVALTRQIGESQLNITGRQFAGISAATAAALRPPVIVGGDLGGPQFSDPMQAFGATLARFGLTMRDVTETAARLGITLTGAIPTMEEIAAISAALAATDLSRLLETFSGQMERLRREFDLFDVTDPIEQLQRLQAAIGGLDEGALSAIQGLNLATAEGRAQADAILRELFRRATGGGLSPEQIGALFGGLTPTEFLDALAALEQALDAANQATGGSAQLGVNRSITEATGSRMAAILTTDAYWNEQTAGNTERIAAILDRWITPGTVRPPSRAELDRFAGSGGGGVVINGLTITIQFGAGVSASDAERVGRTVGGAVAAELDRILGSSHSARVRTYGQPNVN